MMCFYNDYDWYADEWVEKGIVLDRDRKCWECNAQMRAGDWCMYVWQQEHGECQRCEYEELGPDEEPCVEHDYGEMFEYWRCVECSKLLSVIYDIETEEGCPEHAKQPALCELSDELFQNYDARKWLDRAIDQYPDLAAHRLTKQALDYVQRQ